MEFVGPKARSWIACQFGLKLLVEIQKFLKMNEIKFEPQGKYLTIFSLGFMSLSLVGYYARDWHDMQVK